MNKRLIIIILIAILILSTIAGLLYMAVQKQQKPVETSSGQLQMKMLLDEAIVSPVASFDNNAIWYFNKEGRLFRVNTDGSNLSEFPLPKITPEELVKNVIWPKLGSDFIAITASGAKKYFDSIQKVYVSLPGNIKYLDWMPDGKRIVYLWQTQDGKKQQIVLSNADSSGYKAIGDVFWSDLAIKLSPDGTQALMWRGETQDVNKIYSIDLLTGKITTLVEKGKNIGAYWISPTKFLFADKNDVFPRLSMFDTATKQITDLKVNTNLDKTTADRDGKNLYLAVPKKDNSSDIFMKINLENNQSETYFEPAAGVKASNLLFIGDSLYFTNSADGKYYTISK